MKLLLSLISTGNLNNFDVGPLQQNCTRKNIINVDRLFNTKIFHYGDVQTYYSDIEMWYTLLPKSKVPFLSINAIDDPIALSSDNSRRRITNAVGAANNVMSIFTQTGGHLGWVGQAKGATGWDDDMVLQYIAALIDIRKTNKVEDLL
ncbi:hypothetical protein EIN_504100 [Entamoeba invadens IP1]|uniref:Uncharacterized protein n=1 Tax=Entamoeba invadens IP1 TaxID=370355 RepID=A0A0A1U7H0_ENTIV|nr:hypothetical protein EIN_504100 [Entamoeba invadens IP1]ELP90284.1 hypothetical protein EIN_504100 [Entamoeba invadens IP1]|eukprot:XP_004257055.1 hypothetical protein EIN_504100 [Entamoeba invadens IP1]